MKNMMANGKPIEPEEGWFKKRIIPASAVLLVLGITIALFLYQEQASQLGKYGYLGVFLFSLITSATVVLPVPGIVALFAMGATLNPVLVGLVGATGSIIGELTGFALGYGGSKVVPKTSRPYLRAEAWMKRWGGWAVFGFAVFPLPVFDVAGIVAGALRYPLWKFLLIGWLGKCIKLVILVMAGAWGWGFVLDYFG